jgi:hypothetical protein
MDFTDLVKVVLIKQAASYPMFKLVQVVWNKHLQGMDPSYVWQYEVLGK